MRLTSTERERLRTLAKRQAEIAALPVMKEREEKWYRLNDGEAVEPLVTFEFNGPEEEIFPVPTCDDPLARFAERQMSMTIRNHELLGDDRVVPPYVAVYPANSFTPFGYTEKRTGTAYADGRESMGFAVEHVIHDLEKDFGQIRPSPYEVDAHLADARRRGEEIAEVIGDILDVVVQFPCFSYGQPSTFNSMMGMERMMIEMYDHPELFHRAMRMLTDDLRAYMRAIEAAQALLPNNDGSPLNQGSWGYTNDLPTREQIEGDVLFKHVWGYSNSQETVGIRDTMFDEFFFRYIEEIAREFGLFAYGCCEPVDTIWDLCLSRLPNLRKVSVSPWCGEDAIAERIRGKKVVYHRKPSPNYVGVDAVFDEEGLRAHIAKTATAARGCPLEITFRDVLTARGEPWRLTRAIEIVREEFDRNWRP